MAVKIDLQYEGMLRVRAKHGPSGAQLHTDAPVDNQGKGESFSPTDLVATGLGSCMATIMGIYAERHRLDLSGMKLDVVKQMSAEGPRRIVGLNVGIQVPRAPTPEHQKALETAAYNCPVAKSIHPDIAVDLKFHWGQKN